MPRPRCAFTSASWRCRFRCARAQIAVTGASPLAVAIWQAILFASILFHHSNIRLPRRFEVRLARVIVTPRMHGIHHSTREDQTHSNWSSILSVWDILHRTFRFDVPDEAIVIGVPAYLSPRDVTIGKFLTLPFAGNGRIGQTGYVMTPEAMDQFCFTTSMRLMNTSSGRTPASLCSRATMSA